MSNEEQSKDRRNYSAPKMQVHGDVRLVTREAQGGSGRSDNKVGGQGNFKTSPAP